MLYRKIINKIENYFKSKSNKMLIIDGAINNNVMNLFRTYSWNYLYTNLLHNVF